MKWLFFYKTRRVQRTGTVQHVYYDIVLRPLCCQNYCVVIIASLLAN